MQFALEESTTDHVTEGDRTNVSSGSVTSEIAQHIAIAISMDLTTTVRYDYSRYSIEEYAGWKVGDSYEIAGEGLWMVDFVGLEDNLRDIFVLVRKTYQAVDRFIYFQFELSVRCEAYYLLLLNGHVPYGPIRHQGIEEIITKPISDMVNCVQESHDQLMTTTTDVQNVAKKADKVIDDVQTQLDALRNFSHPPEGQVDIWEGLLSRAEDFIICVSGISCAHSVNSVICAVMAYLKTFVRGSLTRLIGEHVTKIVMSLYNGCTKRMKHESGEHVVDFLGMLKDNWKDLRNSNILKNIGGSLTAIMAICYGGSKDAVDSLNQKTGGLFNVKMWDFSRGCTGLVDLILASAHFFLQKGVAIMNGADVSILMYDDDKFEELDKRYSRIISWQKLIDRNELDAIEIHTNGEFKSREGFTKALDDMKKEFITMKKNASENIMKATLAQRIFKLDSMISAVMLLQRKRTFIKRAFTNLIFGGSGVAKTFVRILQYKAVCAGLGIEDGNEFLSIPNESETKYDSEYNPSKHHSMLIDDLCNTRYEWYSESPLNRVLRCNNNTPSSVLKAEADEKGLYQYNLRALYATTNVKDVGSAIFSNNAASIMRRFDYVTTVRLKPEYTNSEGTFYNPTDEVYPNAWYFKVERVKVNRSCTNEGEDMFSFVKVLESDNIWEFTEFMGNAARAHDVEQEQAYIKAETVEKDIMCKHFRISQYCTKCQEEHSLCRLEHETAPEVYKFLEDEDQRPFSEIWKSMPWFKRCTLSLGQAAHKVVNYVPAQIGMGIGLILLMRRMMQGKEMTMESTPSPPVPELNEEGNAWAKKKIVRMPMPLARTMKSASTDSHDLIQCLKKSLMTVVCIYKNSEGKEKQQIANMVPLKDVYWLTTSHSLKPGKLIIANVAKEQTGINGAVQMISEEDIYRIPNTDMAVVRVLAVPVKRGYLDYFPTASIPNKDLYTTCVTRLRRDWMADNFERDTILDSMSDRIDSAGILTEHARMSELKSVKIEGSTFQGYMYKHSVATFYGMCGSPYVVNTKGTVILGIHSGGCGEWGFCHAVERKQLLEGIEALTVEPRVTFEGNLTSPQYEYDFDQPALMHEGEKEDDIPPDHPLKFLDANEPCVLEIYGPHNRGRRSLRSNVKVTPISQSVEDIMGLPRIHGKPKHISTWRPWQQNLVDVAQPKNMLDPDILRRAGESLAQRMIKKIDELDCKHYLHPWDFDSCVNGVDMVNGADRLCVATSAGLPICKPKRVLAEGHALVDEYGTIVELRLTPEVKIQVDDLITKALKGERMYVLYQAHVKDEATKLTKDKLRVFAGTQLAFLIVCKMYLGGLNRMFQNHWDQFECCISANCYNADWTRLYKSVFRDDRLDRCVAGDYVHWDKSQTPQLTLTAGKVHLACLRHSGNYDEDDLRIAEALYTEFAYPIYEWDGVYFQAYGSLPSGVFATVMISNANNSILFRYTYLQGAPLGEENNYDKYISANFMGDDNLASVAPECTWWDMQKHRDHLAKAGITYTSADKVSELTRFVSIDEVTYLKRRFVWSDEVQQYLAPLEEASIAKSLHCYMKRKNCTDPIEGICGNAMDSALREYMRHGKEVYERRKEQLQKIADVHDIHQYLALSFKGNLPSYETMLSFYLNGEPTTEVMPDVELLYN